MITEMPCRMLAGINYRNTRLKIGVGQQLKQIVMKKLVYSIFTCLLIGLLVSCEIDNSDDTIMNDTISPVEFYNNYMDNPDLRRIDAWTELTDLQRYSIWKQRLEYFSHNLRSPRQRHLVNIIESKLTLDSYLEEKELIANYEAILPELELHFTWQELYFIFETLHPYEKSLTYSMQMANNRILQEYQRTPIPVGPTTFEDESCDCRSYCGPMLECCGRGGCDETTLGCGWLLLNDCTSTCINEVEYDCNP